MFCVTAEREEFFLHTLVENLYCLFGDVLGSSLSTLSESISLSFSLSEVKKKNMNCCVCVCVVLRQHGYGKITLLSQFTRSQTHNEHTQKPLGGGSGNFTGMQVAFPRIVSVQGIPAPVSVNLKKPLLGVQQVLQLLQSRVTELGGLTSQTFRTLPPNQEARSRHVLLVNQTSTPVQDRTLCILPIQFRRIPQNTTISLFVVGIVWFLCDVRGLYIYPETFELDGGFLIVFGA